MWLTHGKLFSRKPLAPEDLVWGKDSAYLPEGSAGRFRVRNIGLEVLEQAGMSVLLEAEMILGTDSSHLTALL